MLQDKIKFKGIIDRFEGDLVIVHLDEEGLLEIPKKYLPPHATEGSILKFLIKAAKKETEEKLAKVKKMIKRLTS